jgi:plastocyanin
MRRVRLSALLFVIVLATSATAKDVYLSIGGSAGKFRTDARIFNPSHDKIITITARYLPTGNVNNADVATKTITVEKRSMGVYDDVVQSLFGGGPPLGAVRLTSDDDFIATQRIFADESAGPQNGTLGQFVPGLEVTAANTKGILVQLKQNGGGGQKGTFRTNWGGVNPNASVANVTFKLYDRNNVLAGTTSLTFQPFGVFAPTNIGGFFGNPSSDLSNAWISYESDQPIFAYASVLDNGSEDPTFVPASTDTGVAPPAPQLVTLTIVAEDFRFVVTPSGTLKAGTEARFILSKAPLSGAHGIRITDSSFNTIVDMDLTTTPVEQVITLPTAGTYFYVCTNTLCDSGSGDHFDMLGDFTVEP